MARTADDIFVCQSEPITVQFCGMESDTATMASHGWHFAMDEDYGNRRLGITHPDDWNIARVVAHHKALSLTLIGTLHGGRDLWQSRRVNGLHRGVAVVDGFGQFHAQAHIVLQAGGSKGTVWLPGRFTAERLTWRDAIPHTIEQLPAQELHTLPLFTQLYAQPQTVDLITDQNDVQALLERIMQIQAPIRKEIRARDRQRERDAPAMTRQVHAQIVTLAEAA